MENNTSHIEVNNLGILKEANIEISKLTVFIGKNNSGKSFISKIIHCFNLINKSQLIDYRIIKNKYLNDEYKILFIQITNELNDYLKDNSLQSKPFKISIEIFDELMKIIINEFFIDFFENNIKNQFDGDLKDLINFNKDFFSIKLNESCKLIFNNEKIFTYDVNYSEIYDSFNQKNIQIELTDNYFNIKFESSEFLNGTKVLETIVNHIISAIFNKILLENSYYIPAERSELISDKKLLTRNIRHQSNISKNQRDVLADIYEIDQTNKGYFFDLACEFEKEFSNIKVDINDNGIYNEITYYDRFSKRELSSKFISTSISEISVLILYLKYILKKDDLLIVEEPEAHIHPGNQRILIKYLIKAVNSGLKLLFTTHSDYIINQINNSIMLNNLSKNKLDKLNFNRCDVLNPAEVNLYHFKNTSPNLFTVEKIEIKEDGFMEDNFKQITHDLYRQTIDIINSI